MHATQIKLPKLGRKHASMVLDKWSRQRETHEGAYVTQVRRQGGSGEKLVCDTARTSTECATCRTAPCRPYTSVSAGSCNTAIKTDNSLKYISPCTNSSHNEAVYPCGYLLFVCLLPCPPSFPQILYIYSGGQYIPASPQLH